MYFAVMKLSFEQDEQGPTANDSRKELRSLCQKLRSRFKVTAAPCATPEQDGFAALAIAAFGSSEEKLTQLLDAVVDYCENSGYGRIESEDTLMDHIDAVSDYDETP